MKRIVAITLTVGGFALVIAGVALASPIAAMILAGIVLATAGLNGVEL